MQVHKPSEAGEWHLEHTPCIEVLVRNKAAILDALTDAKYDKITHVRQAVGKALVEMDCIPSPKSKPTVASMLSEEGPDLETLLASKRAEPNNRPWSGTSTDLEMAGLSRSGSRGAGYALEEAGQADHHAPSPTSDMGTSFEPDQITGDSPTGTGRRDGPEQALHSRQGSRREWAGKASCSLNRYNWVSVCTHCNAQWYATQQAKYDSHIYPQTANAMRLGITLQALQQAHHHAGMLEAVPDETKSNVTLI